MDSTAWPDPDALLALVRRLPDDAVAHADFAAAVYFPLLCEVQALNPTDDPARVERVGEPVGRDGPDAAALFHGPVDLLGAAGLRGERDALALVERDLLRGDREHR